MVDSAVLQKMYYFLEEVRARRPEILEATPEKAAEIALSELNDVVSHSVMYGRTPMPGEQFDEHEALRRIVLDRQGFY